MLRSLTTTLTRWLPRSGRSRRKADASSSIQRPRRAASSRNTEMSACSAPPAVREWEILQQLWAEKLPVPRPLAVGRAKNGTRSEYLITEAIPEATDLYHFGQNEFSCLSRAKRTHLLSQLAEFIRDLHNKGIHHRDLHCGNILLQHKDDSLRFYLVDLYSVRRLRRLSERRRIRNVASLVSSLSFCTPSERARLIREILSPEGKPSDRPLKLESKSKLKKTHPTDRPPGLADLAPALGQPHPPLRERVFGLHPKRPACRLPYI